MNFFFKLKPKQLFSAHQLLIMIFLEMEQLFTIKEFAESTVAINDTPLRNFTSNGGPKPENH